MSRQKIIQLITLLITLPFFSFTQIVQSKIHIENGQFLLPIIENNRIALLYKGALRKDSIIRDEIEYMFPVSCSFQQDYMLDYTIFKGTLISISIISTPNGRFLSGPLWVGTPLKNLRITSKEPLKGFLERGKKTTHYAEHWLLIDGRPAREALEEGKFRNISVDFASTNQMHFYLSSVENDSIKIYQYPIAERGLYYQISDGFKNSEEAQQYAPTLYGNYSFPKTKNFNTFYLNDLLFLGTDTGMLYQLGKESFTEIGDYVNNERPFSWVIDKDRQRLYVVAKDEFLTSNLSFAEILRVHGKEILIPK